MALPVRPRTRRLPPAMDERTIREMLEADEDELTHRLRELERLLRRHYGKGTRLCGKGADLELLQRALDDDASDLSKPAVVQSLGLAFGNVLASELGLDWVIVEDEYGSDPALRHPETDALLHPLTMVSGRIEDEHVDLQELVRRYRGEVAASAARAQ